MRILLTVDSTSLAPPQGCGGFEPIVNLLLSEYQRRGHVVGLVTARHLSGPASDMFFWNDATPESVRAVMGRAFLLRKSVHRFRPDLLHSFTGLGCLSAVLPSRIPKVATYQGPIELSPVRWARRIARRSLRFTACSEYLCGFGRRAGGAWRAIPHFVDPAEYRFEPSVAPNAPLLYLDRIESANGPHLAVEIARRAGRRLILCGARHSSGREARYFEEKILPHLGRDGIDWIDDVGAPERQKLLGTALALVAPLQWHPPFAPIFIEAMACGTPVLCCSRGAVSEIVEPGETGFFFENAFDGAMAVDRAREINRQTCRRLVETQFSAASCADQYISLYETMLAIARGDMH